jgi:hypothetical protein
MRESLIAGSDRTVAGSAVVLAALVLATAARAEERRLTDADVRKALPILRAEGAALAGAQAAFDREAAPRTSFTGDPLEWLKKRARIALPKGAVYQARCSRAASGAGGPVAIFTFGRAIDCYHRTWREGFRSKRNPEADMTEACRAEGEGTTRFLDGVQASLLGRGFVADEEGPAFRKLSSGDGKLRAVLHPHNVFDRANRPDDHPLVLGIEGKDARESALAACSAVDSGPLLEIRAAGGPAGIGEGAVAEALRQAGLDAREWEALKEAMLLARVDVEQGVLAAEEAAAAALEGGERPPALEVRRSNADMYRRHAAALAPLFDALTPGAAQ